MNNPDKQQENPHEISTNNNIDNNSRNGEYVGSKLSRWVSVKELAVFLGIVVVVVVVGSEIGMKKGRELEQDRKVYEKRERGFVAEQYEVTLPRRTVLQQPRHRDSATILWKITPKNQPNQNPNSNNCVLISSTNLITTRTTTTLKTLLNPSSPSSSSSSISTAFITTSLHDTPSIRTLHHSLSPNYTLHPIYLQPSTDLKFVEDIRKDCGKVVYIFGNFQVGQGMERGLLEEVGVRDAGLFYTSRCRVRGEVRQLDKLDTVDLKTVQPINFYSYLYIFDTRFFNIMTPTNFVYYAKYTLQQILLIPNLVLFQSSGNMYTNDKIMHSFSASFIQNQKYAIKPPPRSKNMLCFISYPYQPDTLNFQQAKQYLQSISSQSHNNPPTIILYVPYHPPNNTQPSQLSQLTLYILQTLQKTPTQSLSLKLRLLPNKVPSTYAVYESVYSYCPQGGLAVTSRHNVRFHVDMVDELTKAVFVKYHYYYFGVEEEGGSRIWLGWFDRRNLGEFREDDVIFQQKLRHVQVFKTDLMKMVPFWILKSAQLDFFHTQIPFVFNMLQTINYFQVLEIPKILASITPHKIPIFEQTQLKNFKHYTKYYPLRQNYLVPYKYNCLENPAFERNAPDRIPAKIHQIWMGKGEINQVRMKLHDSIKRVNGNFQVFLWRQENVSISNFPIAYNLLNTITQKHKTSIKSIYAMAADILRYQILHKFGGIYIDFKFEAHKPLDGFLKYELIFTDLDISTIRFGSPKAVGNGFMAATPNNYHLKMLLTQFATQRTINFMDSLPWVTGSFVIRKSLTDYEIFTQLSYGYHLAIPNPYQQASDYCGGRNRKSSNQQQIFQVKIDNDEFFKMPIPCKMYELSYLVLVSPLSGTWLKKKENVN